VADACEERAVSFVLERGLSNTGVGTASAAALLELCNACCGRLAGQFESITARCLQTLRLPHCSNDVAVNVLKGIMSDQV